MIKQEFAIMVTLFLVVMGFTFIMTNPTVIQYERVTERSTANDQRGIASWYDYKFIDDIVWNGDVGTITEVAVPCFSWEEECYTQDKDYAASRKYERGTMLRVTNLANDKYVIVRVTDYIEHPDRVIDLTSWAFSQIADLKVGLIDVKIEPVQ